MDSIVAAIISSIATLLAVILASWLSQRKTKIEKNKSLATKSDIYIPDKSDIYFMVYLLHESYVQKRPYTSTQLAEHHSDFGPLEVEIKLMNLEKYGYIQRTNRKNSGAGEWQILPKGLEFMLKNGHALDDLIEEDRLNYQQ